MAKSEAFCMDCLEAMRQMPDNAYDLAVVDPPYGDAGAGGGWNRFGGLFDRYKTPADGSPAQLSPRPREREREKEAQRRDTDRDGTSDGRTAHGVTRTGGKWAAKFGKKLSRGT